MMKKGCLLFILLYFTFAVFSQEESQNTAFQDSVSGRFARQLTTYPQEKIYVQTDKNDYLSGEHVWFRAHIVDALTHFRANASRYVYIELINPLDEVVDHVKVRPDTLGIHGGYFILQEDLPEGTYTLRAYTRYMRNREESTFFRRTIHVIDPLSLQIDPRIAFTESKSKMQADIVFVNPKTGKKVKPESVTYQVNKEMPKPVQLNSDSTIQLALSVPDKANTRVLSLNLVYSGKKYHRYYSIPPREDGFDVSFHPEGGYLLQNTICKVAFKALNKAGLGEPVSCKLFDKAGNELFEFKSYHLGMGFFSFMPLPGEKYSVECTNDKGITKRFDLPASVNNTLALSAQWMRDLLYVSVNKPAGYEHAGPLYLLVHTKGLVLYTDFLSAGKGDYRLPRELFPSGVSSLMLVDAQKNVLSERLVFNINEEDLAKVSYTPSKPHYKTRDHVQVEIQALNIDSLPLQGDFSVSVTADLDVNIDTTMNILSTLLLTSELKGYIESPASYIDNTKRNRLVALDALMMTQGWRRYDVPKVLKGVIEQPHPFKVEKNQEITGKVEKLFRSVKNAQVFLMATNDSIVSPNVTVTDKNGRFCFDVEYPDFTYMAIKSFGSKGGDWDVITVDKETFPGSEKASIVTAVPFQDLTAFIEKADQKYSLENGIRTVNLAEVTVTTSKRGAQTSNSKYYSGISSTGFMTADDIGKRGIYNMRSLLSSMPGLLVSTDRITTTRSEQPVLFVIDDIQYRNFALDIDAFNIDDIQDIFLIRDAGTVVFGAEGSGGVVVITTKRGYTSEKKPSHSVDRITPLGYQAPAEFYSPVYETEEAKNDLIPDLRSTIYWKPNVVLNEEGKALLDFYSADTPTTYSILIEGVSTGGHIIHAVDKIEVK